MDKPSDLAGLLTNLEPNDVLFIDEIHRLSPVIEEYLYSAMEDFKIDIMIDSGPSEKCTDQSESIYPNRSNHAFRTFNSSAACTFCINSRLEYYDVELLSTIVERSAEILEVPAEYEACIRVASGLAEHRE